MGHHDSKGFREIARRAPVICAMGVMAIICCPLAGIASNADVPVAATSATEAIPIPVQPSGADFSAKSSREVPSISGQYSIGGTTVMPFLGAGFGGGYTLDVDRSMNNGLSTQTDPGLRNWLGQSLVPNEFRLGIRIPF